MVSCHGWANEWIPITLNNTAPLIPPAVPIKLPSKSFRDMPDNWRLSVTNG